jgi:DNA-binding helix-hairpin-helix protein with protein kinase domain
MPSDQHIYRVILLSLILFHHLTSWGKPCGDVRQSALIVPSSSLFHLISARDQFQLFSRLLD